MVQDGNMLCLCSKISGHIHHENKISATLFTVRLLTGKHDFQRCEEITVLEGKRAKIYLRGTVYPKHRSIR